MLDCVIRDVTILDGTGAPARAGDVAAQDGRITFATGPARVEVRGEGRALAPGFIDVHTHDDFAALLHPDMAFKVRGGVTTCVVGNCGMGPAPFEAAARTARMIHPGLALASWGDHAGYFAALERSPASVNIAALVGHGTVRAAVMGLEARAPTTGEFAQMKDLVLEGLEAGAVGLSSGLVYDPGRFAATEELIVLASLLRGTGGLYATHLRDEGVGLVASVEEAIRIGETAGVPVQISHHKASGRRAWGLVRESLARIDAARARGVDVHADQYPYTAGSTILSAVVGGDAFGELDAADVVIASAPGHADWEGRSIAALARAWGEDGASAARRILAAAPGATIVAEAMSEDDVRAVMRHPTTMIGSDGIPTLAGRPHPRLYGTFARVLGRYSRELGLFSLVEAVRRMTGLPAAKFGLVDRGVIREGARADLVLFRPGEIVDAGTFADPQRWPAGIDGVWVNGVRTVDGEAHTGARAGAVLRRERAGAHGGTMRS